MKKTIGNLEIYCFDNDVAIITKIYNDTEKLTIKLRGLEEIQDLIYVLKQVEGRIIEANGRHLPG